MGRRWEYFSNESSDKSEENTAVTRMIRRTRGTNVIHLPTTAPIANVGAKQPAGIGRLIDATYKCTKLLQYC